MRKKSLLQWVFLLFALIVGTANTWATDFTLSSASEVEKDGITVTFAKGSGSTAPTWYSAGLRLYASNTITITSSSNITGITFNWEKQGSKAFASVTANSGTYSHPSNTGTGTWSGSGNSVTFTVGSSGQLQLNTFSVTVASGGGGDTPTTYTVTYDSNNGTGTMTDNDSPYSAGATVTVLGNEFTRDGYTFTNWNTAADGSGTSYDEDDTFTISTNTTLYAQWTANGGGSGGNDGTIVFDFEDNTAHRTSGSNSYSGNTYIENGATITLTYADAVTTGSPLSGSANVMGRIARNTTNSPVIHIGAIDITGKTITSIAYITKGVQAMAQNLEYSLDDSEWNSLLSLSQMPTSSTTETVDNLSITGTNLYLKWTTSVSSSTGANRDFQLDDIVITYTTSSDPVIVATAPEALAYNAASGEFDYSITNPTGATLSATSNAAWITNVDVDDTNSKVTFSTSTNTDYEQRTGTIALSYTGAIDKVVTITQDGKPAPSITAEDVEIVYNATNGSIAYTIVNPDNGTLSASVPQGSWVTLGQGTASPISFTCEINPTAVARTTTVTLTYSYDTNKTATKEVTVTQAGNPDLVDNISDITELSTSYKVRGTVVATNSRGFVIGDGTGYVYTYLSSTPSQEVGDMVTINGTTASYGHILQFNSSATIAEATTSNYNNTPAITVVDATAIATYNTDYQLSDYVQFEGTLTSSVSGNYTNYNISVGTATARISYPTTAQATDLDNLVDKVVRVKGYFSGFSSSTFTVMLESIEEVVSTEPSITVTAPSTVNVVAEGTIGEFALSYENLTISDASDFDVQFYDSNDDELNGENVPNWITVSVADATPSGYKVTYSVLANDGAARTAYFKVYALGDDYVYSNKVTVTQAAYVAPLPTPTSDNYIRISSLDQLTDGSIVIIAARHDDENADKYYAMSSTTSGKPTGVLFTSTTLKGNDILPSTIVDYEDNYYWVVNISTEGGNTYYTFTNKENQVLGYTSSTNFATNGNNTAWTIERSTSGDAAMVAGYTGFVIKNVNTDTRGFALNNSYNFGPYATSNMTGSDYNFFLDLFVQMPTEDITVLLAANGLGTYVTTNALDFANCTDFYAYKATVSGNTVTFDKVTKVPEGTPLLVRSTAADAKTANRTVAVPVISSADDISPNALVAGTGTNVASQSDGYYNYVLTTKNGAVGFYLANNKTVPTDKAYLKVQELAFGGSANVFIGFDFDGETTAVRTIDNGQLTIDNGEWYTLDGRRLNGKPTQRGLYIVNGQKVVIK